VSPQGSGALGALTNALRTGSGTLGGKAGPPALWRTSTAVSDAVATSMGFSSVADLSGPSYIPPERLKKVKALGEGAFAGGWAG